MSNSAAVEIRCGLCARAALGRRSSTGVKIISTPRLPRWFFFPPLSGRPNQHQTFEMSLYHETASVLDADPSIGGNLRSRVFNRNDLKAPQVQVYALAVETCKWSSVLAEVIDNSQLLQHEKKVSM